MGEMSGLGPFVAATSGMLIKESDDIMSGWGGGSKEKSHGAVTFFTGAWKRCGGAGTKNYV
jgi:hypothetical protein